MAYGAGLRASEVCRLKVGDVDSQRMALRVEQGKGPKDRYAMLSPVVLQRLRAWWRIGHAQGKILPGGWLFPGMDPMDPLTPRQLNRAVHEAAAAAGIAKRVTTHTLRHCFATHLLERKVDIRVIQVLLGHKQLETTSIYTHVATDLLREVIEPAGGAAAFLRRCLGRPALEVADIFREHGPAWRAAQRGHLSLAQLKVMSAIEQCRTAALGGHVLRCEGCGTDQIAYNSCRNRHCPKCQSTAAQRWLDARQADLLPVEYYHVVFTLPAPIADIAYQNKAVIYGLLFDVAAEVLLTIAADPKHLGARIGATLVLHTWGSALTHHPHVHGIVPGGGLAPDGKRWVACRPGFFLPVRVLSRLFRRRFLEELQQAASRRQAAVLRRARASGRCRAFKAWLAPLRKSSGWSMPSAPSPDRRRCWPTCRATRTAWRSPTAVCSRWTSVA